MGSRRLTEGVAKALMLLSLVLVLSALFGMMAVIVVKGWAAMSISMVTQTPQGGYYMGREGGIANAILGSLCLAFGASLLALLIALPVAFALQREYATPRLADATRLVLDILWGTPSIVYGAFGFTIMVYLGLRASLLGGIIVLTLLMMPIMVRSMEEVMRMVPL